MSDFNGLLRIKSGDYETTFIDKITIDAVLLDGEVASSGAKSRLPAIGGQQQLNQIVVTLAVESA